MFNVLAHLLNVLDTVERAYWVRMAAILSTLSPVDRRRFMYGRD